MDKIDELIILLEDLLRNGGIDKVFYINPDSAQAIPQRGNFSGQDRLAIPFSGCHRMDIPAKDGIKQILPKRHNATFMPEGCWNYPDWGIPVKVVTFGFADDYVSYSFVESRGGGRNEKIGARGRFGWCSSDGKLVLAMMRKVFAGASDDLRAVPLTEALAAYCLASLKKRVVPQSGKAHSTYVNICSYIEECYSSDLSRDEVAGLFNISSNYLSNLFKSQAGIGFSSYINQLRIKRACHLLKNFNQTLDEVAFSCGYHETGYFCRVFKKHTGSTPGEYRR